uniref:Integrase, catalytic region, zinc finger, CCHC-type, peptidase aspartic, catalytic n=1 Tax=Tanacetum cinerariifolium TaxID=118510 RepID=A0A699I0B2_TANCI|nr:integrase, catalytic region, zinc finger, CCHC-type, peptidase aspartic, catalytic [Tanacetum cinerariifolium]
MATYWKIVCQCRHQWKPTERTFTLGEQYLLTRDVNGVDIIKGNRVTNLYTISVEDMMKSSPICYIQGLQEQIMVVALSVKSLKHCVGIFHQKSVPRTPQHNDVVERQNRTLVEAAMTMLIFPKAPISGLVPDPVPAAPYVPPTNKDLEILFQQMFDEYYEPLGVERLVSPAPAVQIPVVSAAHHHLNLISIPKCDGPWRIDDCVVMLVFEACGIPLRFGEVQLSLVAFNP